MVPWNVKSNIIRKYSSHINVNLYIYSYSHLSYKENNSSRFEKVDPWNLYFFFHILISFEHSFKSRLHLYPSKSLATELSKVSLTQEPWLQIA